MPKLFKLCRVGRTGDAHIYGPENEKLDFLFGGKSSNVASMSTSLPRYKTIAASALRIDVSYQTPAEAGHNDD